MPEFRTTMMTNHVWHIAMRVWDIVYPRSCYGCHKTLAGDSDNLYLCFACWRRMALIQGGICKQCAMPLGSHILSQQICPSCDTKQFAFTEARAGGKYEGLLRNLLLGFKFQGKIELSCLLAALIRRQIRMHPFPFPPQIIVATPLTPKTERERGYNQSALLATALASWLDVPYWNKALVKSKETRPQATLELADRKKNLHDAFAVPSYYIQKLSGKVVLLVDDILTTGNTAHECARTLKKQAGVAKVYVAAVGRSIPLAQ